MKKLIAAGVITILLTLSTASFAETRGQIVFKDTIYGLLTGALIGAALMTVSDEPEDHFKYIGYGATAGAIAGAAFGVMEATEMVEYKNGNLYVGLPTVQVSKNERETRYSAGLLKVNF